MKKSQKWSFQKPEIWAYFPSVLKRTSKNQLDFINLEFAVLRKFVLKFHQ